MNDLVSSWGTASVSANWQIVDGLLGGSLTMRVLVLFCQGKDTTDIARALHIPEYEAYTLLHRALEQRRQSSVR